MTHHSGSASRGAFLAGGQTRPLDPALIRTEIDAPVRLKVLDRGFKERDIIGPVVLNLRR